MTTNNPFPQPICDQIWNKKYRLVTPNPDIQDDLSVQDTWRRIANACADTIPHVYGGPQIEEMSATLKAERRADFYHALEDFKFLTAGRITAGAGSGRNVTLFNCYVMGTVPDAMGGIFDMLKEAALTMQQGGGIGYDFSTLRPKGAPVRGVDADASGPLTFMDVWDSMCRTVMSAGSRRGAMMATMSVTHPDIEDFIVAKKDPLRLRMFNLSVMVTDPFMQAVEKGEKWRLFFENRRGEVISEKWVDAKELWEKIMQSTYAQAEPGIIFIDRINKMNNLWYMETIASTNPCFAGNQMILTDQGPKTFMELEGKRVSVLTENQVGKLIYRPMDVFKTAKDQEILRITLDDGSVIDCTHTHEFFDLDRNRVEARDLKPGHRLASVYRHNANSKGYKRLTNGIDNPLEHHVPFEIIPDGFHVHHKNEIKDDNRPENLELILGLDHNSYHMQGDRNPSITHPENNWLIQQDHSGENNGRYREDISDDNLQEMRKDGMSYKAIADAVGCSKYTVMKRLGYQRPNHKVVSVEPLTKRQDVYCGTVDETHRFFIGCERGGVLVSNCGEQPLPPYGACLLGSLNLTKMVNDPFSKDARIDWDKLKWTARMAVRMLDSVIDVSLFPIPAQKEEAKFKRRMGIGISGLADLLFMLNMSYGTEDSADLAEQVMMEITLACYEESIELAQLYGPCPATETLEQRQKFIESGFMKTMPEYIKDGIIAHGIRNSHLTSIAPTGTISLYAGNISSGVEPIFAPSYTRKILEDDGSKREELVEDFAVKLYREYCEAKNIDGDFTHLVTAQTLTPMDHLRMQASVQKWIDSSISKTVNCPEDISYEDFKEVYIEAWKTGCKGCTTYRPNDVTGSVLSIEEKPKEEPVQEDVVVEPVVQKAAPKLIARPDDLPGHTYKVKSGSAHAMYITLTYTEQDGIKRPYEVFMNSKNMEHFAWTVALTRMISAVFRKGGDVSFVVEELKAVFDPRGGNWIKGKYVPSDAAAIGGVIEQFMKEINYIPSEVQITQAKPLEAPILVTSKNPELCSKCFGSQFKKESGCETCLDCGHSKCG